jgi:hypothetical protein
MKRVRMSWVLAGCAMFLAFGTTSYAAFMVGTNQLRKGAVTTPKLHKGAVTAVKLRMHSVTAIKLAQGAVTARAIADGAVTAQKLAPAAASRVGYADVVPGASPTFVAGTTSRFTAVSHAATGTYCLTPDSTIDSSKGVLVATPDAANSTGVGSVLSIVVEAVPGAPDCSAGQFEVQTKVLASAAGVLTDSDAVAFTVIAT